MPLVESAPPILARVIHPVDDIDRAVRFFSTLLGTAGTRVSPGRHYFRQGSLIFACYDPAVDGDTIGAGWRRHPHECLYFLTDDLGDAATRIEVGGGRIETLPEDMPWGERLFYARDPSGHLIACVLHETFLGS